MKSLLWFIRVSCVALVLGTGVAEAQPAENGPCGLTQPAFCETFDQPAGTGDRSGELNGTLWGVSRLTGEANLGQGQFNAARPTQLQGCDGVTTVQPGTGDVIICNGQLREATNDQGGVTALAMYPKQPFDFAGRTGIVTFDVSNDAPAIHTEWPEFWMSDQPVPVPFTHFGSLQSVPRNGFGIRFAGVGCGGSGSLWTVDSAIVVRNYVPDGSKGPGEKTLPGAVAVQPLDCVTTSNGMAGSMNHIEIHVSQSQLDVYATDAGTTAPLKHIAVIPNVNLSFTRGLIWIVDAHYNAVKFGGKAEHTFAWDNVGFDGPSIARDLTFDALDNAQPVKGYPGQVNLGWGAGPGTGPTLTIPGVYNIENASAALVVFHFYATADPSSLTYAVNGHSHTVKPSFAPGLDTNGGFSPITFAEPVPLDETVPGTNTVTISTNLPGVVSNVDLTLVAAGGNAPAPPAGTGPVVVAPAVVESAPPPAPPAMESDAPSAPPAMESDAPSVPPAMESDAPSVPPETDHSENP